MAFSGTIAIRAMKDGDYQATIFAGTTAGLQAAIDYLAGVKGKVSLGPGTLEITTAIWIHSYCHLHGSGRGQTIIKRASGSITDSDAAGTGAVIVSSAYGANGTVSSSAAIQYDIEISDLTVDGNSQAFGSLTSSTPDQFGIYLKSVDGIRIHGTTVQNTLRSGYFLAECKDTNLSDVWADTVGQFSVVTTRNAFDFYNFSNATSGHGKYFIVEGFRVSTVGDVAFSLTNVSDVSISNGHIDGCDSAFELQGSANTSSDGNVSISNVVTKNMTNVGVILASNAAGHSWNDIVVSNCVFGGHPTLHDSRVLALEPNYASAVKRFSIVGCTFYNINTLDTTGRTWIDLASNLDNGNDGIFIKNCSFFGKPGSNRTGDTGLNLINSTTNFLMDNCLLRDVPGRAVRIHDSGAAVTLRNIVLRGVVVDTCTGIAFQIAGEGASGTITDVHLIDCVAKDSNTQQSDSGFAIGTSGGSTSVSRIFMRGCRAYKTSGSTMQYGLDLNEASGTVDQVTIENCDFTGVATAPLRAIGGTPTNVHMTIRSGRGTDIASAATISIPADGDVFHVTGTTNITNGITVNPTDNGRLVRLIFDSTPTVSDTGTSVLNGDFVATANDVLTLTCEGTNWYEVARSPN